LRTRHLFSVLATKQVWRYCASRQAGQNSFICSIEKAYMTKEKDGKPAEQVYRIAVAGIN
jgi:hypothetical protein